MQQSMHRSIGYMVVSHCSWPAETGKLIFLFPRSSLITWLSQRDRFGHPMPSQSSHSAHAALNLVLTHGLLSFLSPADDGDHGHNGVYRLSIPSTAIGLIPSLSGHAIAYRWRSRPKVRPHRASNPSRSLGNGS